MAIVVPVAPSEASRLNQLGCGSYQCEVRSRGGATVLAELPYSSGEWNRVIDDTATATVSVQGLDPGTLQACAKGMQLAVPWRTELAISRNGSQVWSGPIIKATAGGSSGTIEAVDLSAWLWRRRIHNDHTYASSDLASIFNDLVVDAMSVDTTPGLVSTATATGILGARTYLAGQHLIAGEQLGELSRTGIDWTMLNRTMLAGGLVVPTAAIVNLEDRHVRGQPTITLDGTDQANDYGVQGAGGGQGVDPVYGSAVSTAKQALDGVLEAVTQESTILDNTSAAQAAATRLALYNAGLLMGDTLDLEQSAPVTVAQLVPGALVGVALSRPVIPFAGTLRLYNVKAVFGPATEVVSVTLQPIGTTG